MLERLGLIGVLAAALGLTLVACGEGGGINTCTSDGDCDPDNELCHPSAKVCVRKCSSSTDCPDEAKTCKTTSATGTQMICTCSTDELCARELGAGTVCSDSLEICTSSQNVSCTTTATQPAGCAYGQYCATSANCEAVPAPTCTNISIHGTTWNAGTSSGPIIYSLTPVGSLATGTTSCQAGQKLARVKVRAYRTTGTFPAATDPQAVLADLHYVKSDGSEATGVEKPFVFPSSYTLSNNNQHLEFDLGFCPPDTISQFTAGLHFVNGNEMCVVVQ